MSVVAALASPTFWSGVLPTLAAGALLGEVPAAAAELSGAVAGLSADPWPLPAFPLGVEDVRAPPVLLTPEVGVDPNLEVGLVVSDWVPVPDGLLVPEVEVVPAAAVSGLLAVVPDGVPVPDVDEEVVPVPESVEVSALATAAPRPRAAKPRKPAMAVEAVRFLMLLTVVMGKRYGRGARRHIGRKMRLDEPNMVQVM